MNVRLSSTLRRTLLATLCCAFSFAQIAYAINHNPVNGEVAYPATVSLSNGSVVSDGSGGFIATVDVELEGDAQALTEQSLELALQNPGFGTNAPESLTVDSATTYTFTVSAEQAAECDCAFTFNLSGLTHSADLTEGPISVSPNEDGDPSTGAGGESDGGGAAEFSVSAGGAGDGDKGSAGKLAGKFDMPSEKMYKPESLRDSTNAGLLEKIPSGSGGIRQMLSKDKLTDIQELVGIEGYQIRQYPASAKGEKEGDVYVPTAAATRVTTVMKPGGVDIAETDNDEIFRQQRWGKKFSYEITVPNGVYGVELETAELYADTPGRMVYNISAQGEVKLANYDPVVEGGGKLRAQVASIDAVVDNGKLRLDFNALAGGAHVSAIKVITAAPSSIANTDDVALYQTARKGSFTYQLAVPNGDYLVSLHFAETTFGSAGKRTFDVSLNGGLVLDDYDIYTEAGGLNTAVVETLPVTVGAGQLELVLNSVVDQARLSAVVIRDALTNNVVTAINAGGPLYTDALSLDYVADEGFTGGSVEAPGLLHKAINAGGKAYTAGGVTYEADSDYIGGKPFGGGYNKLKVSIADAGQPARDFVYEFVPNPETDKNDSVILTHPSGLKKEKRQTIWSEDRQTYSDLTTIYNADNTIVSEKVAIYENLFCGWRKVREVLDPYGDALTTEWTYEEGTGNPDDRDIFGYGKVKAERRPGGAWTAYEYDKAGRITKTVRQYLDSPFGVEAQARVETVAYSDNNPAETRITTIAGVEVARSYLLKNNNPAPNEFERKHVIAVAPGAAWNAAGNLVTTTRTYASTHPTSHYRGQTKWVRSPDGTMTIYSYAMSGDDRIVTRDTGAPNVGGTAIADGTRTVTTTNVQGQQIAESIQNISTASGVTSYAELSYWDAAIIDDLGRPTLIGYGDGTNREIVYVGSSTSCGSCSSAGNYLVASEIDRNGVTALYAYDALNRRTETTRLGVTEKVIYDAADRVVERIRIGSDSSEITLEKTSYDLAGRVISVKDALENQTTIAYTYPVEGGMISTTSHPSTAAGIGTRIQTTHADGRVREIFGTAVSPVRYAYGTWSATGQAGEWTKEIKVGDADAETEWTKTYTDLARRTVRLEFPATSGTVSATMAYNDLGQLVRQADPDGIITLYAYNAEGHREITAISMDQDDVIDFEGTNDPFFAGDRITKTVSDVVSKSGTYVRRTITQVWGTDIYDIATTVSTSEQDGYGNESWQTDIDGNATHTLIERTADGAWTITTTRPDGTSQVQAYEDGRLASSATYTSTSALNLQTTYAYDAHGRLQTQADARTGAVTFTYTDRDEAHTATANNGTETTAYTYDALGNRLTITHPSTIVDNVEVPHVTTNEYHLRNNQLKKTSGSQTYPVEYAYDLHGRMKTMTTWQNATSSTGAAITTWNYDTQRGWLAEKLYADSTGPAYEYTPGGRLAKRTWVRTVSSVPLATIYAYNNAGELISTDYSDSTPDVAITHTRFGAQKTVTDATGTRTFTYDPATLRLQSEALPSFYGDRILTRSYQVGLDLESAPLSVPGRPDGYALGLNGDPAPAPEYSVVYAYDTAGRLDSVTDLNASHSYTYMSNSNLRSTLTSPVHVATTTYEPYRDVIDIVENTVGTTTVSKFDYLVNSLGQRTQRANTGTAFGTTSTDDFTYNAKGEVASATNATFTARNQSFDYDDIGNRLTFTSTAGTTNYTANSLNQYAAIASATPAYDADGNQTSTGLGQAYIWDAENRLICVEPLIPGTGDNKVINTYDAQSRRVRRAVFTYASGAWALTTDEKFIYDGWNVVAVLDATDIDLPVLRTHTWGVDLSGSLQGAGGVGGLLAVKDGASVYHYTYDANGNVSEVLNNAGAVVAHYEYDAFGDTFVASGTYASANEYRFSTKPLDAASGLYYYGYRYYNPSTGRWPRRDPIEERGGIHLYVFVENNPMVKIDFLGRQSVVFPRSNSTITLNVNWDAGTRTPDTRRTLQRAINRLRDLIDQCCKQFHLGCGNEVIAERGGTGGIPINMRDMSYPLVTGPTSIAEGYEGGQIDWRINHPDQNPGVLSHELGHVGGYRDDQNPGVGPDGKPNPRHTNDPSNVMSPYDNNATGVDKCFCSRIAGLAR